MARRLCRPKPWLAALEAAPAAKRAGLRRSRAVVVKKMNDMLIEDGVMIPLVYRGRISAQSKRLAGHRLNAWDSELWNIADWARKK